MRAGPRSAADRGLWQFMSPNACAVAEVLMANGFDARWRFNRNGSPPFGGLAGARHGKAELGDPT
jgi:hypothetical protein